MKLRKSIKFVIVMVLILVNISSISIATINPDDYQPNTLKNKDYEQVFNMVGTIVSALTIIGTVISVVMVMALGIKYMMGSLEERAEYKKSMLPMLIGAILLFSGSTIVSIIYQLVEQLYF